MHYWMVLCLFDTVTHNLPGVAEEVHRAEFEAPEYEAGVLSTFNKDELVGHNRRFTL